MSEAPGPLAQYVRKSIWSKQIKKQWRKRMSSMLERDVLFTHMVRKQTAFTFVSVIACVSIYTEFSLGRLFYIIESLLVQMILFWDLICLV